MKSVSTLLAFLSFACADPGRPCSQDEVALATGIHLNIQAQYAEYNSTLRVIEAESQHPGDLLAFSLAKGALQNAIQVAMNIRLFNQQLSPPDQAIIAGLAKYQDAQAVEKAQVDGLCGDYAIDREVLQKLEEEVMDGIKLNEDNLQIVTSVCDFTVDLPPANETSS